ncbi:MAG TPA: hypothetical protein VHN14_09560 [Kofleriaceae bacterium]|jgi:hypothetical protein|nr:hypothetical protein [Kofleriaceae bacterium]
MKASAVTLHAPGGAMDIINALLLIVGGVLAISGLVVAKAPNAKELIDKLMPYQALIGVAMLALGVLNLLRTLGSLFSLIQVTPLQGIAWLGVIAGSILLGFLFGMSQLVQWIPVSGATEQKGREFLAKLAPYQVILGISGIGAALIVLLYRFHLLTPGY